MQQLDPLVLREKLQQENSQSCQEYIALALVLQLVLTLLSYLGFHNLLSWALSALNPLKHSCLTTAH
jgi:hypothetical protein